MKMWRVIAQTIAAGTMAALPLLAQSSEPQPQTYVPHPVTVPERANYLTRDGAVQIVGNDGWDAMMAQFNELFLKTHPDFGRNFHLILKGSSVAIPGLETGISAFAPMGRAMWDTDRASFHRFHGYDPVDIRIGYDAYGPRNGRKSPPGIYVNAKNPLPGLTVEQVQRILTEGNKKGDVSRWGQPGVDGRWANRTIHIYGLDPSSGGAVSFRMEYLNGLPFNHSYEGLEKPADVIRALAEDPYGIALLGFVDAASVSTAVHELPVAAKDGESFVLPSYDVVHAGGYPFPSYLHIYIDREPGKAVDPFVKEYVRMVLSKDGQKIIAEQKDTEEGYVPLDPRLIAEELKKLE
jgi:phosphate transport system substrate-binding protein